MDRLLEFKQPLTMIQVIVACLPNIAYIDQYSSIAVCRRLRGTWKEKIIS
jgi:hypothetical protein